MENNLGNNQNNMAEQPKGNGALIGSIVIIVLLIIGAVFLLKDSIQKSNELDNQEQLGQEESNNLSNSDEMNAIEADLNSNADMDSIDEGIE